MARVATWIGIVAFAAACSSNDGNVNGADGGAGGNDANPSGADARTVSSNDAGPPVAGCNDSAMASGDHIIDISSGGVSRQFRLFIPESYDSTVATPVVVNFHGVTSYAEQQEAFSGMRTKAAEEGFIAVHPDGIANSWNAGPCCGTAAQTGVDDVGFVSDLLDHLESLVCVDQRRVYATGMSNGGFMTHRVACEISDRFAAIASVTGGNVTSGCNPSRPMPVLHFHGTADTTVDYAGSAASIKAWATRNGCSANTEVIYDSGPAECESYAGCDGGVEVIMCTITGFGHWWPGAFGQDDGIHATDTLWEFFTRYSRP